MIDQFEELFPRRARDSGRVHGAGPLAADRRPPVRIVLTLRADMLDRPLAIPLSHSRSRRRHRARPAAEGRGAGRRDLRAGASAGVGVEPGLLAELVADVAGQPGALPLLQFALAELFDRRDAREPDGAAYRELGGVAGAVARGAEDVYGARRRAVRDARQLFLRLVDARADGFAAPSRAPQRAAGDRPLTRPTSRRSSTRSRPRRLLSFDRDPETREPTVEIAHDALLDAWDAVARVGRRGARRPARAASGWRGRPRVAGSRA